MDYKDYTSALKINIHSLRDVLEPMIKDGMITGWTHNALELPQHFQGIVKRIKGVSFACCPSCLEESGYGSKTAVEPDPKNPHREAFTPAPWISAQYEMFSRLMYAYTNSAKTNSAQEDIPSFCESFKLAPRGMAPIGSNLHRMPIGIAVGGALLWPAGMIEHHGAANVPDPNINFCVICPEHGSVWATISPEMINIVLLCANIGGAGGMPDKPGPMPEMELMEQRPEIWSYNPDDDVADFTGKMEVVDLRTPEDKKHTFGYVAAAELASDPTARAKLQFFPFSDEVDQLAAEEEIKKTPGLEKLKTFSAEPYEGGNISIGRILRYCFETSALDSRDTAVFRSLSEREQ